ncbi:hypothetical protein [Clavibacter zhangzhiyongii]|uniref:hypothetical protein n=1 Tax=Clavibacter TaxID=1573 RepID=UPI0039E1EAB0
MRRAREDEDEDEPDGITTAVTLHGHVLRPPRCIRTAEGWEVATVVVGAPGHDVRDVGEGIVAVCMGPGAVAAASSLTTGAEVVVQGRMAARRGSLPADDAVELVADALLVRRVASAGSGLPPEPRIAP